MWRAPTKGQCLPSSTVTTVTFYMVGVVRIVPTLHAWHYPAKFNGWNVQHAKKSWWSGHYLVVCLKLKHKKLWNLQKAPGLMSSPKRVGLILYKRQISPVCAILIALLLLAPSPFLSPTHSLSLSLSLSCLALSLWPSKGNSFTLF